MNDINPRDGVLAIIVTMLVVALLNQGLILKQQSAIIESLIRISNGQVSIAKMIQCVSDTQMAVEDIK